MNTYIVFNRDKHQFIVSSESWVRAIQEVLMHTDSLGQCFAADNWTAHRLSDYNPKIRARLIADSVSLSVFNS